MLVQPSWVTAIPFVSIISLLSFSSICVFFTDIIFTTEFRLGSVYLKNKLNTTNNDKHHLKANNFILKVI